MNAGSIIIMMIAGIGLIFMLASLTGIKRFPDFFTRLHAQGVGDTLGAFLIILAMMLSAGSVIMDVKLFLIFVIILLTNPLGTNLMMKAAIYRDNYHEYQRMELKRPQADGDTEGLKNGTEASPGAGGRPMRDGDAAEGIDS